jgi:hypothetical protein
MIYNSITVFLRRKAVLFRKKQGFFRFLESRNVSGSFIKKTSVRMDLIIDLFDNPVGYLTSLAVFQAKALQNRVF